MAVYSVSQVSSHLKEVIERDSLLQDVWVGGEVSNLARPGSGHSYFTLRDANASLRCVMFRNSRGSEQLDNGAAIIAHGRVSIYEVRGDLQLIVDIVQPEGVGELQMKLEQLKLKLETEGLFEPSRKRELPAFPQKIGVVSSPTGAVWHDIQDVIGRRYPLVELMLAPAPVQGETAAPAIAEAIQAANDVQDLDVIIVARGGGSLEDLWPFNEELVARAIYGSRVPLVSAIGHETDYTIADMVADVRAPTPSAAAELVVPDRMELSSRILVNEQSLNAGIWGQLSTKKEAASQLIGRVQRERPDLDSLRIRVDDLLKTAYTHLKHNLAVKSERFGGLQGKLHSVSPKDTMRRGYAIIQMKRDGAVVSDATQVREADEVDVTLSEGGFGANVTSVRSSDDG